MRVKVGELRGDIFLRGESWGNLGNWPEADEESLRDTREIPLAEASPTRGRRAKPTLRGAGGIRLRKNTSLQRGAVVRVGDDFFERNAVGGAELRVFRWVRALRFARRGRAPKRAGALVGRGLG